MIRSNFRLVWSLPLFCGLILNAPAPGQCLIDDELAASNCQSLDPLDTDIVMSDLSILPNGVTRADDFVLGGLSDLSELCVWGAYLDPNGGGSVDCGRVEPDIFRIRVYNDAGGLLGLLFDETSATGANVSRIPVASTFQDVHSVQMYEYALTLDSPILALQPGTAYWLEIANDTSDPPFKHAPFFR